MSPSWFFLKDYAISGCKKNRDHPKEKMITACLSARHLVLPNSCKASQQIPAKVLAPHEKMEELG